MPKKPEIAAAVSVSAAAAKGGTLLSRFPTLRGVLTDLLYEGTNERRKPGSVTIRADGGMWFAVLRDPTTGLMLRTSAEAFDDLLPALEGLLSSKSPPWEPDPYAKPERPRGGRRAS